MLKVMIKRPQTRRKLNLKQKAFLAEYLNCFNATEAYSKTYGKSRKNSGKVAHILLKNPLIKAAIEKQSKKMTDEAEIDAAWIIKRLKAIADSDVRELVDESGAIKDVSKFSEKSSIALSSIEVYEEKIKGFKIGETKKIKFWDKVKALELLGKHVKMFTDKLEHTGKDGEPLPTPQGPQIILTMPANGRESPDTPVVKSVEIKTK